MKIADDHSWPRADRWPRADCRPPSEAVFVLHGFAGNRLLMYRMAQGLRRAGYAVHHWTYSSVRSRIAGLAERLRDDVQRAEIEHGYGRIHVVAHSLGSIIAREAFCVDVPAALNRLVMLAPPNSGSHVARAGALFLGRMCPVLHELSSATGSYVNQLESPTELEIGIIAAARDWVVRRHSTVLSNQTDYIVLTGDHVRLPLLRRSVEQTIEFLRRGQFSHAAGVMNDRQLGAGGQTSAAPA